jgi:threonine synthase
MNGVDEIQELLKNLFADESINAAYKITTINSVNVARVLAQITYYFASYFQLIRMGLLKPNDQTSFVVPSGNFGNALAGFFAKRMGVPMQKIVIATNENDILYRFCNTGAYEKEENAHAGGVKQTLSPAMDILISSNFERLLWFMAHDVSGSGTEDGQKKRELASLKVKEWQAALKAKGGFSVEQQVLDAVRAEFVSERVTDAETLVTIRDVYRWAGPGTKPYVLDPHSAVSTTAALRRAETAPQVHYMALLTAHPAKFSDAVEKALESEKGFRFDDILPPQFVGLDLLPRRLIHVTKEGGLDGVRKIIMDEVEKEFKDASN